MFVIVRHVRRLNLKNTWLRLMLFLIVNIVCVCIFVFGYRGSGIGFVQKERKQSWTAAADDDDESLSKRFIVQPPSVEHSLPIRIGLTAVDGVWQQVPETKSELHVFSAHLDTRIASAGPLIRVIGTAKTRTNPDRVWCRLWYAADGSKTVSAHVVTMREHRHLRDNAVFVLCKLPPLTDDKRYPSSVSVVANVKDPIDNELAVLIPDTTGGFAAELGICVKPFHGRYHTETRLMEFVELNRLFGVSHFTFYNGSVAPNVQCVLERYNRDGLISVIPWYLNLVTGNELTGTEGQFAALNDCLYRNMYKARLIAFLDVDEIIVPRHHDTLLQMIESCEPQSNRSSSSSSEAAAAYLFRHAFFCMEWPDDDVSAALDANRTASELVVLRKTLRRSVVHEYGARSKFVCDPRRTVEVGSNFVWRFLDARRDATFDVPTDVALLHHYVNCSNPRFYYAADTAEDFVADRTMYRYEDRLVDGITKARDNLDEPCLKKAARMNGFFSVRHPKQDSEVENETHNGIQ